MKKAILFLIGLLFCQGFAQVDLTKLAVVQGFDNTLLSGFWDVQDIYGNGLTDLMLDKLWLFRLNFGQAANTSLPLNYNFYNASSNLTSNDSINIFADQNNPGIFYFDQNNQNDYIRIVNLTQIGNNGNALVLFVNWLGRQGLIGITQNYLFPYDIRGFLIDNDILDFNANVNYFRMMAWDLFLYPTLANFSLNQLLGSWDIISVYDPNLGNIFPWNLGYCGKINFLQGQNMWTMDLSMLSFFQGNFSRYYSLMQHPNMTNSLFGFVDSRPVALGVIDSGDNGLLALAADDGLAFLLRYAGGQGIFNNAESMGMENSEAGGLRGKNVEAVTLPNNDNGAGPNAISEAIENAKEANAEAVNNTAEAVGNTAEAVSNEAGAIGHAAEHAAEHAMGNSEMGMGNSEMGMNNNLNIWKSDLAWFKSALTNKMGLSDVKDSYFNYVVSNGCM